MASNVVVIDEPFLAWLRQRRCVSCKLARRIQRFGTEAHHVGGKGMGGARRRDDICIPVCRECHMRCEGQTVDTLKPIGREQQEAWSVTYRTRYERRNQTTGAVPW